MNKIINLSLPANIQQGGLDEAAQRGTGIRPARIITPTYTHFFSPISQRCFQTSSGPVALLEFSGRCHRQVV
jgi:hypothetical protein